MATKIDAPEREILLRMLDEAYERKAWHGTNLRGALRGLGHEEAIWRPANERHNIWELTLHAAYWKYAVRRRIIGGKRGSFPRKGSNWFAAPPPSEEAWREDVALLDEQHRALRQVVAEMPLSRLKERSRNYTLVYGLAAHDLYHTGQIQLIKRLRSPG